MQLNRHPLDSFARFYTVNAARYLRTLRPLMVLVACSLGGTQAPLELTDPVDQITYLAFADLRQDSSAQCFLIHENTGDKEPSPKVTALLMTSSMQLVPRDTCNSILADGDIHPVLNISIQLPDLDSVAPSRLDIPYSRLCGSLCGTSGTCHFTRRGQRWSLRACKAEQLH
jgi:hypothetical protein